jgi:hypothetical protein
LKYPINMKNTFFVVPLLALWCCTSAVEFTQVDSYLVGYSQAVITPSVGTEMLEPQGQKATGIHDDLFVRVLALSDDYDTVVVATFDLVGMDLEMVSSMRESIWKSSGIAPDHVMLSTSHAHNTPVTVALGHGNRVRDRSWENDLIIITTTTVQKAIGNLQFASLSFGSDSVQIAFNRRLMQFNRARMKPNPAGPVAKETSVLLCDKETGGRIVLFNYPAHPVSVHNTSTEITADYPGFAVDYIENNMGLPTRAMFAQGCAGDINVDPLQGGFPAATHVGGTLGRAVIKASANSQEVKPAKIYSHSKKMHLPYRPVNLETADLIVKRVEEGLTTMVNNGASPMAMMDQRDVLHWAEIVKHVAQHPDSIAGLPFEIQVISVGKDLAIIGMTHELFVDYQLYIQAQSPFKNTLVFAYTNGCASYIPTAEAFYLNGYEIHGAQHRYAQPYLTPECDEMIRRESTGILNDLFEKYRVNEP